jgi:spore photoproduct lyase
MRREELRVATLAERLAAAKKCAEWGYLLAFHFDPIIAHQGWQSGYRETIDQLFSIIPADKIVWISLGALRYLPALKDIARQRFPQSAIFSDDFVVGLDGKKRYFRTLRAELYRHLYQAIAAKSDERTCIYFCMESDEIWQQTAGFVPADRGGLPMMLDMACKTMREND